MHKFLQRNLFQGIKYYRNQSLRCINDLAGANNSQNIEKKPEQIKEEKNDENYQKKQKSERFKTKQVYNTFFTDEERKKNLIKFHEDFFSDDITDKSAKTFKNAVDAFNITNRNRQLYIDFVYGALLKIKEYNAHKDIEAYKKLINLFPVGPLRVKSVWQRDNMHYPRHQNCVLFVLETMEQNGNAICALF